MAQSIDIFVLYEILKRLVRPFNETDAYKLGLIDEKGKKLKSAKTKEEKDAVSYLDRFVFNLKRLLGKAGLNSKTATFAAALLLLKEQKNEELMDDDAWLEMRLKEEIEMLKEDAPTNATGAAVAGSGDTGVHWSKKQPKMGPKGNRKKYGQPMNPIKYMRKLINQSYMK